MCPEHLNRPMNCRVLADLVTRESYLDFANPRMKTRSRKTGTTIAFYIILGLATLLDLSREVCDKDEKGDCESYYQVRSKAA